ncbi:TerD family protein [Prevotella fusca]|uniref:Tellurium resistance protein TerD n=1 Tax=Prevotella fusca JCM 17724 TaxID=1236517 RepID=A0A0K1NP45_9BACT|nr:TerD family protein [Prevotella fusca]AKU70456.1 Tellurium resistance protein TerD [Prevotella fusca JCM 17724]QUB86083.1 TerD family protein [Prevotella fusca JCM 17724]
MAIQLEKGQRINLEKENGSKLTEFCVGCNWGAVTKKAFFGLSTKVVDVDLDLSCVLFDEAGKPVDHIWSPLYRFADHNVGLPNGKLDSADRALHHTGDDLKGDQAGDDGLDNEIITVDLSKVNSNINSMVFFLNIYNNNEYSGDFSGIPYASIRMFEGTPDKAPKQVFAQYDVATQEKCAGMRALVMGKLYRRNGEWKFAAIGDAFPDPSIIDTIGRVMKDYSK